MTREQAEQILDDRMKRLGRWLDAWERAEVLCAADSSLTPREAYVLAQKHGQTVSQ